MEQIIINVDNIILSFVHGSFGSLSETVHALWQLMFIVFIAVYGYKVMVSGRFSTSDLITHCLKIIVLLVLATVDCFQNARPSQRLPAVACCSAESLPSSRPRGPG